jgi:uncharacterized membrane protein YgdD (TMEM256/DUF423 family)
MVISELLVQSEMGIVMLKILIIILGTMVFLSSVYRLYTDNSELQPYITLLMGLMMLVMGIDEFKKGKNGYF